MPAKKNIYTVLASAARGTGNYTFDPPDSTLSWDDIILYTNVTAAGTTLAVDLQASFDGTTWVKFGNTLFTGITGTGLLVNTLTAPIPIRLRFAHTSTGNFTYQVYLEGSRRGPL